MSDQPDIFRENPYDIEALVDALGYMHENNAVYLFLDSIVSGIRQNPDIDLIRLIYETSTDLLGTENTKIDEVCYETRRSEG